MMENDFAARASSSVTFVSSCTFLGLSFDAFFRTLRSSRETIDALPTERWSGGTIASSGRSRKEVAYRSVGIGIVRSTEWLDRMKYDPPAYLAEVVRSKEVVP